MEVNGKIEYKKHKFEKCKKKVSKKVMERLMFQDWRIEVKKRDDYSCVVCNRQDCQLNIHHIIPYVFKKTRMEIINGITLCPFHHRLGMFSAHQNSIWFSEWLKNNRPEQFNWAKDTMENIKI